MSVITKDLLKKMRPEIDEALKVVAQKYGMTVNVGNMTFTSDNFVVKTDFKVIQKAADGSVINPDEADFKKHCYLFDLKPEDYGGVIKLSGKDYQISGLNMKSRTKPIKITRVYDGKSFITNVETVKNAQRVL